MYDDWSDTWWLEIYNDESYPIEVRCVDEWYPSNGRIPESVKLEAYMLGSLRVPRKKCIIRVFREGRDIEATVKYVFPSCSSSYKVSNLLS